MFVSFNLDFFSSTKAYCDMVFCCCRNVCVDLSLLKLQGDAIMAVMSS